MGYCPWHILGAPLTLSLLKGKKVDLSTIATNAQDIFI